VSLVVCGFQGRPERLLLGIVPADPRPSHRKPHIQLLGDVTWQIEPVGGASCRLTVTHDQLHGDAPPELYGGWPMVLSGLKTWLETGQTLTTPGSLMYDRPS
jgi:hypothetical protein